MPELATVRHTHTHVSSLCQQWAPGGDHAHRCPNASCGHEWRHCDINGLAHAGLDAEAFEAAHRCPECGTRQVLKAPGSYDPNEMPRIDPEALLRLMFLDALMLAVLDERDRRLSLAPENDPR